MDVMICSASHYLVPNGLVALATDPIPDRVIILCGTTENPTGADKNNALQPAVRLCEMLVGRVVAQVDVLIVPPYDLVVCRERLIQALSALGPLNRIIVNVTGGTTPMSFAAAYAAQSVAAGSVEVVYFQPQPNRLISLKADTVGARPLPQSSQLNLDDYFLLHGFKRQQNPPKLERNARQAWSDRQRLQRLFNAWVADPATASEQIRTVNTLAHQGNRLQEYHKIREFKAKKPDEYRQRLKVKVKTSVEQQICQIAIAEGLMEQREEVISFKSIDDAKLMGGLWYEFHIYNLIRQILPHNLSNTLLQQIELNRVEWDCIANDRTRDQPWLTSHTAPSAEAYHFRGLDLVRNTASQRWHEIDLALYVGNQLHIIECKTSALSSSAGQEGLGQDVLNKLSAHKKNLVGPKGTVALIHPAPLPDKQALIDKANAEDIKLWFGAEGLSALEQWLQRLVSA